MPTSGPESTGSAADGPAGSEASGGAAQQQQRRRRQQEVEDGVLVGTVEVSFTESTRTRFLTLNPPKVHLRCVRICAVSSQPPR